MIKYKIVNIEYMNNVNDLEKVAANIHWYATATNDEGKFARSYGNQHLDISGVSENNFIAFDDLTEEQVLKWLFTSWGDNKNEMEVYLNALLEQGGEEKRELGLPSNW